MLDCLTNKSNVTNQKSNISSNKQQQIAVKYDSLIKIYYNVRDNFKCLQRTW